MKIRILALTGLFAALILSACGGAATPMPEATEAEDPGVTAIVAEGRLVPEQHVDIAFRASGQVKQVLVAEGDTVSEGEVIALLDDTDQQQAVNKAQLAVEQAQISVANAQHNLDVVVGWSPNKGQLNAALDVLRGLGIEGPGIYHRAPAASMQFTELVITTNIVRATFNLVVSQGLSHGQAAGILGCSENTVSWRMHKARKMLQAGLGPYLDEVRHEMP